MSEVAGFDASPLRRAARWRPAEIGFWLLPVAAWFVFPEDLALLSQIAIAGLFALSLDLILGYAGIISLGHAAFFGLGGYAAGLLAKNGFGDPVLGLAAAAAVSGVAGFATSFLVLRGADLTRLMVTMAVASIAFVAANQMTSVTGGLDGLQGIEMTPVLGWFDFDLFGRTGYFYVIAVVFVLFWLARRIVHSPFGLSLQGIRQNASRMPAIGTPVNARLVAIYTIAAAYAGIAGALLTQVTQFISIDQLSFSRSAEVMLMLVLGGTGSLYGGLLGAAVFMTAHQLLAGIDPQYWQFWLGILLIVVVLFARGGIMGALRRVGEAVSEALRTTGLVKRFGGFVATNDVNLAVAAGARHALIGPNGAGKTTLINLLTGFLAPSGGTVTLNGREVTHLAQHRRVKLGLARTFQINRLFMDMTVLQSVLLAVCERRGIGARFWRAAGAEGEAVDEAASILARLRLLDLAHATTRGLAYGKQRLIEIALALAARPSVLLLDEPAAGVPTTESRELFETIAELPREVTILLIEHDMDLVFRFADRITVLVSGAVLTEGDPAEIAADARVREVYLGDAGHG